MPKVLGDDTAQAPSPWPNGTNCARSSPRPTEAADASVSATPDVPGPERDAVWTELPAAGVDHLNTDDLAGLEHFLRTHDRGARTEAARLDG